MQGVDCIHKGVLLRLTLEFTCSAVQIYWLNRDSLAFGDWMYVPAQIDKRPKLEYQIAAFHAGVGNGTAAEPRYSLVTLRRQQAYGKFVEIGASDAALS